MRVRVTKVESKNITTKSGQAMTLRVVQGANAEGDVFKFVLPRGHDDISEGFRGEALVTSEPYINFDAELAARVKVSPVPVQAKAA